MSNIYIKLLFFLKKNPFLKDENGCTPLMFASMKNHPHSVKELLVNGADITRNLHQKN